MPPRNEIAEFFLLKRLESLQWDPLLEELASVTLVTAQTDFATAANYNQFWYDIMLNFYLERVTVWERYMLLTDRLHSYYKDLSIPDQVFIECHNGLLGKTRKLAYNLVLNKVNFGFDSLAIHCTPRTILWRLDFMINEIGLNGDSSPLVIEYLNNLFLFPFPWGGVVFLV